MTLSDDLPAMDPKVAAAEAGLRYVSDSMPGIRRLKKGKGFLYQDEHGKVIRDKTAFMRIRSLVIPPAWKDVWICPSPRGHLQATGWDARGRKQYRYHLEWRTIRDRTKYDKLMNFGEHLPGIRKRVLDDLKQPGLPREKVIAAIVRILDITHMRIGNEEYAKENKSYGLTTLHNKHVDISGSNVRFTFRGKSGQRQDISFSDRRLAKIIKSCEELPGYELFQYIDGEGAITDIRSEDINAYLKEITGDDITAKDFRTWGGTVQAAMCLFRMGECDTELSAKHCVINAVKEVAGFLGNRPATCKKYYIDPRIFSAYHKRGLCSLLAGELTHKKTCGEDELQPIEKAVLKLLGKTVK